MFMARQFREGFSKSWLTPDQRMGVHYIRCFTEDYYCLPHTHPEYNVVICLSGRVDFDLSGTSESMQAGDVIVLNPGQIHESRYGLDDSQGEAVGLIINKSELESILLEMQFPVCSRTQHIAFSGKAYDMKVVHLTTELLSELDEQKQGFGLLMRSLIVQILVYLLRNCFEPKIVKPEVELPSQLLHWELSRAIEYMNTRGHSSFSLLELCSELGCSSSRFLPLFKNATGLTPHHYYNTILIERGRRLLRRGDYTIKEVAYELGFRNLSHFYGVFHSFSGMTPKTYQALEKAKVTNSSESSSA
jgi:AraC family transcriptional regulator